jgi:hypothetical protein
MKNKVIFGFHKLSKWAGGVKMQLNEFIGGIRVGYQGIKISQIRIGTAVLGGGGTATVADINVTANSLIVLDNNVLGGTAGFLRVTKTPGTGFTITSSSATDTSTVNYVIIEP